MAKYAVTLQRTASTSQSLGSINAPASGMRRIKIMELILGSEATPADNPFLYTLQRCTTFGTNTAVTPKPLDAADGACVSVAGQNHTIEPTYTANEILMRLPLNQRATFRWIAAPGEELVVPATANNGIGVQTPTASTVVITGTFYFEEQ